jgi:RimJ/RimL family protein N-acetyltransferase
MNFQVIESFVHPTNERSIKLLERFGFRNKKGDLPMPGDGNEDLFALSESQW